MTTSRDLLNERYSFADRCLDAWAEAVKAHADAELRDDATRIVDLEAKVAVTLGVEIVDPWTDHNGVAHAVCLDEPRIQFRLEAGFGTHTLKSRVSCLVSGCEWKSVWEMCVSPVGIGRQLQDLSAHTRRNH